MSNTSPLTKDLVHQLGVYLQHNIPGLLQVLEEWPDVNVQLSMPSITIFTGNPTFSPQSPPEVYKQTTITGDANHTVMEILVGDWEYKMQLDLWCKNKEERGVMFDLFFNAMNFSVPEQPEGLSLQLPNYYNAWCRYDLDSITFLDDEAAAQRAERRVKIMLLVSVPAIRSKTVPIMKTIETQIDIPDTIPND